MLSIRSLAILSIAIGVSACDQEKKRPVAYNYLPKAFRAVKRADYADGEILPMKFIENQVVTLDLTNSDLFEKELAMSTFLDSIWYVKLESKKDQLIQRIDDIKHHQGKIYILDVDQKTLFIFNGDGSFHSRITRKGKGPGEYFRINAFQIDQFQNQIVLVDDVTCKALYFDLSGKFLKEKHIPYYLRDFAFLPDGNIAVKVGKRNNAHIPAINNHHLIITDRNWKIRKKAFKFSEEQRKFDWVNRKSFNEIGEKLYFHVGFTDTLYSISPQGLVPEFVFDLGEYALPEKFDYGLQRGNEVYKKYPDSKSLHNDYEVTSKFLVANFLYPKGENGFVFYNMDSNKLLASAKLKKNVINSAFFSFPIDSYGETFVGTVSAQAVNLIREQHANGEDNGLLKKVTTSSVLSLVKETKEYDNPILVYYKLR